MTPTIEIMIAEPLSVIRRIALASVRSTNGFATGFRLLRDVALIEWVSVVCDTRGSIGAAAKASLNEAEAKT